MQVVKGAESAADIADLQALVEAARNATAVAFDLQLSERMAKNPFTPSAGAAARSAPQVSPNACNA